MKRFLMISLAVLLFSTAASAQTDGYLCLFSDVDHTTWCANAPTIPGTFTMYIYLLPRADGAFGAEFMLDYPDDPDIMTTLETYNSDITIIMGALGTGVGVGFNECKTDWFLIASQPIITMSAVQAVVSIAPHPTSGGPSLADCGPLHAKYDAVMWNSLYINYPPGSPECSATANAASTWGAIKNMYTE